MLERLGQVTVWLFDKTGTLTDGRTGIVRIDTLGNLGEKEVLSLASALEAGIEHPIARALRSAADVPAAEAVEYTVGFGVTGREARGEERARLWARWGEIDKDLDSYAALRSTETAVVVLERVTDSD